MAMEFMSFLFVHLSQSNYSGSKENKSNSPTMSREVPGYSCKSITWISGSAGGTTIHRRYSTFIREECVSFLYKI